MPIALNPPSPPVALLINTHNKVQYSTVDHSSKAPAHPIGEEEEEIDVCSLHLFTILQSAVIVIIINCVNIRYIKCAQIMHVFCIIPLLSLYS